MKPFIDSRFRNLLYSWPEKAMVILYDHYYDDLIRIADMHTHDRRMSEDVLQEVFADVWEKRKVLGARRDESIQAYLIKAVSYHSIDAYRKYARTAAFQGQYLYEGRGEHVQNPVEVQMITAERQSFARLILSTLPLRERECLQLRIDHGLSVKEIAVRLNVSVKAVERSLTSARKRLKKFRVVLE